jgi:hypothetical protein
MWSAMVLTMLLSSTWAQDKSATAPEPVHASEEKFNLLFYTRMIRSAGGQFRIDQSFVSNFTLNRWLRLELGLRHGERSGKFLAYDGYKIELQTKSFFKTVRFLARMSDKISDYPRPSYAESNYLLIAEGKYSLSRSFTLMGALGSVWSTHRDNTTDGLPAMKGAGDPYLTYKAGLRYHLKDKGFLEATTGSYDVFNPYALDSPFVQLAFDYELTHRWTLYSYFRHQYDWHTRAALNEFLCVGARLHFFKA